MTEKLPRRSSRRVVVSSGSVHPNTVTRVVSSVFIRGTGCFVCAESVRLVVSAAEAGAATRTAWGRCSAVAPV